MTSCAELALDQRTGATTSQPCIQARNRVLVNNYVAIRRDRDDRPAQSGASVAGWSATLSAGDFSYVDRESLTAN
jgi:hypothetical protein